MERLQLLLKAFIISPYIILGLSANAAVELQNLNAHQKNIYTKIKEIRESSQIINQGPILGSHGLKDVPIIFAEKKRKKTKALLLSEERLQRIDFNQADLKHNRVIIKDENLDYRFEKRVHFVLRFLLPHISEESSEPFLIRHYAHEAFHGHHLNELMEEEGEVFFGSSPEHICETLDSERGSPFAKRLLNYYHSIKNLAISLINENQGQVDQQLNVLQGDLRKLKIDFPLAWSDFAMWEYIEGTAEFVGMKTAVKHTDFSWTEAIRYELGMKVRDEPREGNALFYQTGALAMILAEYLGMPLRWSSSERSLLTPRQSVWQNFLSKQMKNRKDKKTVTRERSGPSNEKIDRLKRNLLHRFCQNGNRQ